MSQATEPVDPSVGLFYEVRGAGQPVLLVPGTPGDGGQFEELADALASESLVISYDRAANSRTPAPSGTQTTSVAEQADDAARLLRAVGAQPALVFGTSNGGAVALELALRHPALVSRAVLHEIPMLTVLADPAPVAEMLGGILGPAMSTGGPVAALDALMRFSYGDDVVEGWDAELRDRFLANGPMVFEVELPAFQSYRPDEHALASAEVPIDVAVGEEQQAPFFIEAAEWLVQHIRGARLVRTPGAHGPQFTAPRELARFLLATG